ncbi:MAG: alpha/beta hydrolase [Synechococcaceae cyanobacterium RL_1_2]|nr:alpha/beta hydrolase [Synechococcaceae cyanobacterium RL_1_2]
MKMQKLLRVRENQDVGQWGLIGLGWWLGLTAIAVSLGAMVPKPALGAEEISLNYGILELKIKVDSLEKYAQKGEVESDLKSLIDFMAPSQRESLKTALATPIAIDVVSMAQLFYSPEGAAFLSHVGELLQTPARQSGFYALRAGLIRAADREEGLTIVNILKEFPLERINLNSVLAFELMAQVQRIDKETNQAFTAIGKQQQQSLSSLGQKGLSNLPDLRARGNVRFTIDSLSLQDPLRDREFIVDLYRPQLKPSGPQTKIPLIVISHGLAANRYSYQYLAEHLASHGWMVAIPEHRGSNFERFDHLLQGLYQEAIPDRELIDRPLDISFY